MTTGGDGVGIGDHTFELAAVAFPERHVPERVVQPDGEGLQLARQGVVVAEEGGYIRTQGYARTSGDMTPGRAVIAISIPGPIGRMPMAVGVGGEIDRIAEKEAEILAALADFRASSPASADA